MNGSVTNNQFTVTADSALKAKMPNFTAGGESFTNAAGIVSIGSRVYCMKANGNHKSAIAYTDNYTSQMPTSTGVVLNAHCAGLTTDGQKLVTIGVNASNVWKVFTVDKDSYEVQEYVFDTTAGKTYAGITHVSGNSYYTCHSTDGNKTLRIKRFTVSTSGISITEEYSVVNGGYAEMIQDIYYMAGFGLFIATNQKDGSSYSPCKNIVLLYDLKNRPSTAFRAKIRFRFNFSTAAYKQFNIESLCIVNQKLVLAANVVLSAGTSADTFLSMENMTFDPRGTVIADWPIEYGREFAARPITDEELVNPDDVLSGGQSLRIHQSLSYAAGKVYGLMINTADSYASRNYSGLFYVPDYMNRNIPKNGNTKYISFNKYTKNLPANAEDPKNLYHCNSLNFDGNYFYVGCCERKADAKTDENGNKYYTVVKMDINGKILQRYRFEERTNCVMPYKDGKFIIISDSPKYLLGTESLVGLHIGTFGSDGRFHPEDKFCLKNTVDVCTAMQDAYYHQKLGLYLARFTSGNKHDALLHYNFDKFTTNKVIVDGIEQSVKVLTPDYAFYLDVDKNAGDLTTIEFESPTVDESAGKMLVGCNARGEAGTATAGSYDCIIRYKNLDISLT